MFTIVIVSMLAAAVLTGWAVRARRRCTAGNANACHQFAYLFQGGFLSESSVESARVMLEPLLEHGDEHAVDALFRPDRQFAVRARALTEIGTESAREALERQMQRTFSRDPLEQAWYRLDVARNLRRLNRLPSLPVLVQAAAGAETPLNSFLAAEAACFPGFSGYLFMTEQPIGHAALLVLLRAMRGLRQGVEPRIIAAARLGEAVEILWEVRRGEFDPRPVRVFAEARRLLARADHAERWFAEDETSRTAFRQQIDRLQALDDVLSEYLEEAVGVLLTRLPEAMPREQSEILHALIDLKADTRAVVLPMLESNQLNDRPLAVESLAHGRDSEMGPRFCHWLGRHVPPGRQPPRDFPYLAALRVLRHFPSDAAESMLLDALNRRDPTIRRAALSSLGWWVPLRLGPVLNALNEARFDRSPGVLPAAQAALARLGERHALRWFRQQLIGETTDPVHRAIQLIAEEGLLLLWPDLDALADADDSDIAFHACEALEHLRENYPIR